MKTLIVFLLLIPSLGIYPQWTALDGPHPNRLTSIAINSGTGRIYATGIDVARHYSDDEGSNWVPISTGDDFSCLVKDSYVFWGTDGGGVMRTNLSGSGFQQVLFDINASFINCIINFNDTIYVGSQMGYVYRSANNGDIWNQLPNLLSYHSVLAMSEISNELYVGVQSGGIYKLSTSSNSWIKVTTSDTIAALSFYAIIYNNGTLIAGTKNNGIYISTNMGSNWSQSNLSISNAGTVYSLNQENGIVYAGTENGGLLKSTDNGLNWQPINDTNNLAVYCFASNQNNYFIGTSDGIYKSTDSGLTWSSSSNGMMAGSIRALYLYNNYFFAIVGHSIFRSSDFGNNWQTKYSDFDNQRIYCMAKNDYGIYANGPKYNESVMRSTDNGNSWQIASSGINNFSAQDIISIGSYLFAATIDSPYVYRSGNNGDNWEGKGNGITVSSYPIKFTANDVYIFVATNKEIFRTSDMGDNWQLLPKPNVDPSFEINSIAAKNENIFISTFSGIYRSTNNGDSWELLSLNTAYWPDCLYFINNTIFAGFFNEGLFYSINNGDTWTKYNSGFPTWITINSIISDGNFMAVGTVFNGIYTRMNTVDIPNVSAIIPTDFELFQNYPNPFNPSTIIRYSLQRESQITIKLYNLLGQEIKQLINTTKSAGHHQITFSARNLASGVYFYRITAVSTNGKKEFVDTKKLILLK